MSLATRIPTVIALLAPTAAAAHGDIPGVGAFYSGFLHPLMVPTELLCLLALALMFGGLGHNASRAGLPLLVIGIALGLIVSVAIALPGQATASLLMGVAALAALSVAFAIRLPLSSVLALSLCGGLLIGLDASPDQSGLRDRSAAALASLISASIIGVVVSALALGRQQELAHVACRVAGSWIASVAILYFGWLMVH